MLGSRGLTAALPAERVQEHVTVTLLNFVTEVADRVLRISTKEFLAEHASGARIHSNHVFGLNGVLGRLAMMVSHTVIVLEMQSAGARAQRRKHVTSRSFAKLLIGVIGRLALQRVVVEPDLATDCSDEGLQPGANIDSVCMKNIHATCPLAQLTVVS